MEKYRKFFGKKVSLEDTDGEIWEGTVAIFTSALDSTNDLEEIVLETKERLIEFNENEIKKIEIISM